VNALAEQMYHKPSRTEATALKGARLGTIGPQTRPKARDSIAVGAASLAVPVPYQPNGPASCGVFSFCASWAMEVSQLWRPHEMARGTVKWFNSQKGYGFVQPQGGGKDVFIHISAVEKAGLPGLNEGQVIEYEEVSNRGKTSAENLKVPR
jgi:cold shock protein